MHRSSIAPIPPGSLDLTGDAVRRRRALQRTSMEVLERAGFAELIPPTFEYEEIFLRASGRAVADRLIRFLDLDGRALALRYDFTSSVARVAATTYADAALPLRLCYSGKVYRQEPERGGRAREVLQVGAELLGAGDVPADVEVLRLAHALLRALGVETFQINLGHVGVLQPGLDALDPAEREEVRRLIDRRDHAGLTSLLASGPPAARVLSSLALVIGRRDALARAKGLDGSNAERGLDRLLQLDDALTEEERRHVVYDLGEVRGLDYYTGIHFEVFVEGIGRAVGAGGRYDELMGRFGRPMPAVGLALDIGAIVEGMR